MALESNALTTVETVQAELNDSSVSTTLLERLVNSVSAQIGQYVGRDLTFESARVDNLRGYGTTFLVVTKTPLKVLTSITFAGDTVDSADFSIDNADAGLIYRRTGWIWTAPRRAGITNPPMPGMEERLYQITYDGGWVSPAQTGTRDLPFDLEDAAIRMIISRARQKGRDLSIKSEKLGSWGASYGAGDASGNGIPSEVAAVLNRYKSVVGA